MAVRLYNECLEGITTTSPPCGYFSPLKMIQKKLLFGSGICTRYRFDTAKLKIYFESAIISSYFLIIFKKQPHQYLPMGLIRLLPAGLHFKLITQLLILMAKYIKSGSKYIKIFLTLYSHPLSFNFNYRSVLQRYSHLPTCTSISKRHKSFRQLYIVGMVVPIAPDTSV